MLTVPLARRRAAALLFACCAALAAAGCRPDVDVRAAGGDVATQAAAPSKGTLIVRVLNVTDSRIGGLAVLVTDSSGGQAKHVLIDGGEHARSVAAQLDTLGVRDVALVVLSHLHADHYGGLPAVFAAHRVGAFAYNGDTRTLVSWRRLLAAVERSRAVPLIVDTADRTVTVVTAADTMQVWLVRPAPVAGEPDDDELNDRSVGTFIRYGRFTLFVPGDAETHELEWWERAYGRRLDADVLVAGHHGSNNANSTASSPDWYRIVTPAALLISSNGRQHPFADVLDYARAQHIPTYCTHVNGTLTVRATRDGAYAVRPQRAGVCTPGTDRPKPAAPRSRRARRPAGRG